MMSYWGQVLNCAPQNGSLNHGMVLEFRMELGEASLEQPTRAYFVAIRRSRIRNTSNYDVKHLLSYHLAKPFVVLMSSTLL